MPKREGIVGTAEGQGHKAADGAGGSRVREAGRTDHARCSLVGTRGLGNGEGRGKHDDQGQNGAAKTHAGCIGWIAPHP